MTERVPPILERRDLGAGAVELDLDIRAELHWFKGHFPDFPILPGVVQIHWAVEMARAWLGLPLASAREFQIKFKAVIVPGDRLTLSLRHDAAKGRLAFTYGRGADICSTGTVFLA